MLFFSVNLWSSTKETPTKGRNNNSKFNSFLAQKLSQNFEITLPLLLNMFKYLYGSQFFLNLKEMFYFSLPRLEPFDTGVGDSVTSDSLQPQGLHHTRPPCPSPTPGVYSNSCSLSQRCHPTISSSVVPFSSSLQSFPVSGSFPMSQLFASGGQIIGVSASASVLPMNIKDWFPLGWTHWISLLFKWLSRVFSNTTVQKHQFFGAQLSSQSNSHIPTWPLEKP